MRISDLLRKAADLVDQHETGDPVSAQLTPVHSNNIEDTDNIENTDTATMIPPLQQKHELLKKATGVTNDSSKFDDPLDDGSEDELAALKATLSAMGSDDGGYTNLDQNDPRLGNIVDINPKRDAALDLHFVNDDHTSD